LAASLAVVEFELARRMDLAARSGSLPLSGPGAMLAARRWSGPLARRLARAGGFAARYPSVAAAWSGGVITSEHVDVLARREGDLTGEQMAAVVGRLAGRWGRHDPAALSRFVSRVVAALRPPPDPAREEVDAYAGRGLSFSVYGDSVLLSGCLPRLEGEAVMAAVGAWAERLRVAGEATGAAARRADGLVALVNAAAAGGGLPTRGGLPVALTVVLERTAAGDPVWSTSRGHALTAAEQRFTACAAEVTPLLAARTPTAPVTPTAPAAPSASGASGVSGTPAAGVAGGCAVAAGTAGGRTCTGRFTGPADPGTRIAALAATLLDSVQPLALGRTARTATAAQRRAMAVRDRGCVIPGCRVPAEQCQAHHLTDWARGGTTDLDTMVLLCWTHHRQVDLGLWTIHPTSSQPPTAGSWPTNHTSPWTIQPTPRNTWHT
jgi:hypothetical protein